MSKPVKIRVLTCCSVKGFTGLRDCTVGKVYDAIQYAKGEIKDVDQRPAGEDGFQFVDDVGDKVFIRASKRGVEIVEEAV